MSEITIYPRMAARAIRNRIRRLKADRATAIISLDRAIQVLRGLERKPNCVFTAGLIQEYEIALCQLRAIDPSHLPSAESVLAIGRRLELAYGHLNQVCDARWERREPDSGRGGRALEAVGDPARRRPEVSRRDHGRLSGAAPRWRGRAGRPAPTLRLNQGPRRDHMRGFRAMIEVPSANRAVGAP